MALISNDLQASTAHTATAKHIIAVGPNSGGVGKTYGAKTISSLAQAAGLRPCNIDADPGLGSLSGSLRSDRYKVIDFPRVQEDHFAEVLRGIEAEHDVFVIDLGANAMTRGTASYTLQKTFKDARARGWRTSVLLMLPAGKDGLYEDADNFANRFRPVADVYLGYRGRERGGDFKVLDQLQSQYPAIELMDLPAGILADISARGLLPIDYARARLTDFTLAAAVVADRLRFTASQASLANLLGRSPDTAELEQLGMNRPQKLYTPLPSRWRVSDGPLSADDAFLRAEEVFLTLDQGAAEAVLRQAHGNWRTLRAARDTAYAAAFKLFG